MPEFIELLKHRLHEASITVSPTALKMLDDYYNLLEQWRVRMNLVGKLDVHGIARDLYADSIIGAEAVGIPEGVRVLDVGTGAGFPGLVIKILHPGISLSLMDSSRRKMDFLASVCRHLGLEDVNLLNIRAEEAGRMDSLRESFDLVVAKGLAPLNILLELCGPLVAVGGRFCPWKGINHQQEIDNAGMGWQILGFELAGIRRLAPLGDARVSVLDFNKARSTPSRYPRSYRAMTRRPVQRL